MKNWIDYLHSQILFYQPVVSHKWLDACAEQLWTVRCMLADTLSEVLFDETLILRGAGYKSFAFPRMDFKDLIEIIGEYPFERPDFPADLPKDYIGLPLKTYLLRLKGNPDLIQVISCYDNLKILNDYRQYFVTRNFLDISPTLDDVVLDCGSCIGDTAVLFARLVGRLGRVHLFDPVPLHIRFCKLQAQLNPDLKMTINEMAVGIKSGMVAGNKKDVDKITPGGLAVNAYRMTSIDDYVTEAGIKRLDFIKMDIEGAELDALDGAYKTIQKFKPRLAISAYHKPNHLWEMPLKIKAISPDYELYFGHHSPVTWESVFYAR